MKIDIGMDFSTKPFGRVSRDSKFSGERFRNEVLLKAFNSSTDEKIEVHLDGVSRGYGSSFLEESFAGLLRNGVSYEEVVKRLVIVTSDQGYADEIWEYIEEQGTRNN